MIKSIFCKTVFALTLLSSGAVFAVPIEGFEDPWPVSPHFNSVSDNTQSPNTKTNLIPSLTQSTDHFTEGSKSGLFKTTWKIGAEATDTNAPFGTAPVWGHRFNVPAPANLSGNSLPISSAILKMDVYNPNNYPVNVTLAVNAASGMTGLKRGPYLEVPANSTGDYTWNLATDPVVAIYSGTHGSWGTATSVRVATLIAWTDEEPDSADFSLYVDNIRNSTAQTDVTAPGKVKILSATQGSAPGKLLVKWEPVTDVDLAGYKLFVKDSSAVVNNTLTFDTTPQFTPAKTATSIEVDVPVDSVQYIAMTSYDNATPENNESDRLAAFAVRLKSDGTVPENHVILDYDRRETGIEFLTTEGYANGIMFNAMALETNNKYFDSASAKAVETNVFPLVPNANGAVVWSNLLDGSGKTSVALSDDSVNKLSAFYYSFGNLMISGHGLCEDLSERGPLQAAFLNEVLQASLVNSNVNVGGVIGDGTAPFTNLNGTYSVVQSVYTNSVAFGNLSAEQLSPVGTSVGYGKYTGDLQFPIIVNTNRVVLMGFAFESLGVAGTDLDASKAIRATLLNDSLTYLTASSDVSDWNLY